MCLAMQCSMLDQQIVLRVPLSDLPMSPIISLMTLVCSASGSGLTGLVLGMQKPAKTQLCDMCEKHAATKVTYDDIVAHKCPALWCKLCYDKLHYDAEDKLIDPDHKVFPYTSG